MSAGKGPSKLTEQQELDRLQKAAAMQPGDPTSYFEVPPSMRLDDLLVKHIKPVKNGSVLLPNWEKLRKGGLAGPLRPGYDLETCLLIGLLQMLFVIHRFNPPDDVEYGKYDEKSPEFVVESVDENGAKKETKKKVYCSYSALQAIKDKIEYPLRVVASASERKSLCELFYNELVSALNQIRKRTMTTVFYELCNSQAILDADRAVSRFQRESDAKAVKREAGSSSGSSNSTRQRTSSSSALHLSIALY